MNKNLRYSRLASISIVAVGLAAASPAMAAQEVRFGAVYCSAQEIPYVGELLPPVVSMVEEPAVKEDIGLTPLQLTKLKESDVAFVAAMRAWLADKKRTVKGKKADDEEIHGVGRMVEDVRKRTGDVLKPHQLARLKELLLQKVGVLAVPKKNLQQLLHLEREQERNIDEIRSDLFKKIDGKGRVVASDGRCKLVSMPSSVMKGLLDQSEKSVLQVLSPEQKEMVERLKGKQ